MSFRSRLIALASVLAFLVAVLVIGIAFSPQRVAQRNAGAPLVTLPASALVTSVDLFERASDTDPFLTLKASGPRQWDAVIGAVAYPASPDRVSSLLTQLRQMRRGTLVTRDPSRMPELGLDGDAGMVVLRTPGRPDTAILLGKRAASGDEEYAMIRGETSAWLARSSIGILLDQEPSYWYDLRVLPGDIQGNTILSVRVSGSVRLGAGTALSEHYALVRERSGQQAVWRIEGQERPVSQTIASAMTERLADLEGMDFAGGEPPAAGPLAPRPASAGLEIQVIAINGDRYVLRVFEGRAPGSLLLTTSWSPWTYIVDGLTLSRTLFSLPELLAP